MIHSGIYIRIGVRNVDLITEATPREFKDYAISKGHKVAEVLSDWMLVDPDGHRGRLSEKRASWSAFMLRCAFVRDMESKGTIIHKVISEWDSFLTEMEKHL